MKAAAIKIPYRQTNAFSNIVLDYIDNADSVSAFYQQKPTLQGIKNAIAARQLFPTDRELLVTELKEQYSHVAANAQTDTAINSLLQENTYTITTAHQTNIFTGPLYFIYKTFHTIKLAAYLKESLPQYNFVPVFYMGSEDADLAELNHIHLNGEKLEWNTHQTGAVGRMVIDKNLIAIIDRIEQELAVLPFGEELIRHLRDCYKEGETIQQATFKLLHTFFAGYGLLVLLPDKAALKKKMIPIFQNDLLEQRPAALVQPSISQFAKNGYYAQVHPREINLFYLLGDKRERIEKLNDKWITVETGRSFTQAELLQELHQFPERFSPNVLLRGLYQEMILPNIAFVGGGSEIAYWLQLQELFTHYKVPLPTLVLRNSLLLVEDKWKKKIQKLQFQSEDFFRKETALLDALITQERLEKTKLADSAINDLAAVYLQIKEQAAAIDSSLQKHVEALKVKSLRRLEEVEKKMLRAERRKYKELLQAITAIKQKLFPNDDLQERYENLSYYYAQYGPALLEQLYLHSLSLEQEFVILEIA